MNPFDQMMGNMGGLAQTMFYGQQCGFDNRIMDYYRQLQQYVPTSVCLHGADCPKCKENREVVAKYHEDQRKIAELKAQDYKNRCKKYMEKHRVIKPLTP